MNFQIPLRPFYPGWRVLIGTFIGASLGIGFSSALFGMFVIPVTEELGLTRSAYNNAYITYMAANCLSAPIIGFMLDRCSIRWMIIVSGIVFALMQASISQTEQISVMLLAMVPLAVATTICGVVGANTVVVRWFQMRRGRALGILAISVSVGGAISQPVTALLIESLEWRNALLAIGLTVGTLISLAGFLLVRDRPQGTEPGYREEFSGTSGKTSESGHADEHQWTIRELLRNRNFWLMTIAVSLLFCTDTAVSISQVAYFQDIGFELTTVSLIVAVKSTSAIFGKLLIGYLADKVDLRLLYTYVASSAILLLAIYSMEPGFGVLITSVALLGITVGGVYPVWSTTIAWLFGARSYGTVMGLVSTIIPIFAIASARYIGVVYDRSGSYVPGFLTFIVLVVASIVLISLIRPDKPKSEAAPPAAGKTLESRL